MSSARGNAAVSRSPTRSAQRFTPPVYNVRALRRPRLENPIQEAVKMRAATLVSAPPGYGKSLLVATACRALEEEFGARTVWIHLDARDNSYDRLVGNLDLAFRPKEARDVDAPRLKCRKLASGGYTYLVEWLEDRADQEGPQILVLDDYEVVEDPEIHGLIVDLITRGIPNAHIIILSRTIPPLSLSRLRHRQLLCEIGRAELAFTREEISSLLREQFHLDVSEQNLRVVEERTEGWPVAVQLVGTALSQRPDATSFISDLSGCDTDVADFLSGEVLSRQPGELVDFLVRISPLTRVSVDLAVAVTDSAKARHWLDRIVKANLLLFPIDRNSTWLRFHPLFREFLLAQLARHPDISRDAILRVATEWSDRNDLPADAINYALELEDPATAERLIMQHAERFVYTTGDHSQFLAWVARLKSYPSEFSFELKYWQAWALIISHRTYDAGNVLVELEQLVETTPAIQCPDRRCSRIEIIRILVLVFKDRLSECMNTATEWLAANLDAPPFDTCSMATSLAAASCATGEFAIGRSALQTARYAADAARSPYAESWVGALEGIIAMSLGDYPAARTVLINQYEATSRALGFSSSALSNLSLLLSDVCYEMGDLDDAARYLKFGLPHISDHGLIESAAAGFRVLIRTKEKLEGFEEAVNACYLCERHSRSYGSRLSVLLLHEYVCLMLRHGKVDKAVEATAFDGEEFQNPSINAHEGAEELYQLATALIKSRVLLATGHADQACRVISSALATAARTNRRAYKVELLIVRSRAEAAAGKSRRAHRTLLEALTEASPLGLVQLFFDEGPELAAALQVVMPTLTQLPDANQKFIDLISSAVSPSGTQQSIDEEDLLDPAALTKREIQILRLIEAGFTNEAIAGRLFLSLRTVKWYLYNIYPKLGVKNRTGALAKAKKMGLM
jgi:ATP/maltotriose-dependent transcriptional regulator MalT